MPGDMNVVLPSLTPRQHAVPRRYEETRPVHIQGYAHTKIIELGSKLQQEARERAENERLGAVRAAEQAIREEAERLKEIAIAKAREDAAFEQERAIKKLKKAHEKAIKEEALRVEMEMTKQAIEQVKKERAEGEARLKKAVVETEEKCYQILLGAVAKARSEEQKNAADQAEQVARTEDLTLNVRDYRANQQKFDLAMSQAAAEKQQALRELQYEKDIEKAKAVQDAEERERRLGKIRLDSLAKQSDDFAKELKTEIEKNKNEIDRLNEIIRNKEQNIENLEMCLFDTRKDFQDFIDNLPPFHKNQAEFMMPMVYLDELEKKGYVIQHLRPPMSKKSKKKKK